MNLFQALLGEEFHDMEIITFLRYGWPVDRDRGIRNPEIDRRNRKGAMNHTEAVTKYLCKEIEGILGGCLKQYPFDQRIGISPINTCAKKNSMGRIVLDLLWPLRWSVNSDIPKDLYLGTPMKLRYPTIDTLARRVNSLGKGCLCFKVDLAGAFRQIGIDPRDYSLLCYMWEGMIFFDVVAAIGLRSACMMCQRITNAIRYIHNQMSHWLIKLCGRHDWQ